MGARHCVSGRRGYRRRPARERSVNCPDCTADSHLIASLHAQCSSGRKGHRRSGLPGEARHLHPPWGRGPRSELHEGGMAEGGPKVDRRQGRRRNLRPCRAHPRYGYLRLSARLWGARSLTRTLPSDSLKCIAWKGRAIVVGFAAGSIEKAGLTTGR